MALKKKMFSGLACFAIRGDKLLLRFDEARAEKVVPLPGVHMAIVGARPMKNWPQAGGKAIADRTMFLDLLIIGRDYALTPPPNQ